MYVASYIAKLTNASNCFLLAIAIIRTVDMQPVIYNLNM